MTTTEMTVAERLAWDDTRIAAHLAAGQDFDTALALTETEWAALTGEPTD